MLTEYLNSRKNKRICVLGYGVSNRPIVKMLSSAGAHVEVRDKKDVDGKIDGVTFKCGIDYLENIEADYIYRSPGIRPDLPQIVDAVNRGAVLTSEMEDFFEVCPSKIIAVTGSDGKTTTTTVISEILKEEGYTVHIGGNIGKPVMARVNDMKAEDIVVLELSSFQLMTMKKSPNIAVITNIAPNHLDIHRGMEEYIEAKRNIIRHQKEGDRLVVNYSNDITRDFVSAGKRVGFTRFEKTDSGAYLIDDEIVMVEDSKYTSIMKTSDIKIPGAHNVENYMAAICAVWGMVKPQSIVNVARRFGGVEHRCEFVRECRGVKYYNDSIASSPTRTIAGLRSFNQKIILIAGGYDKHIPFDELGVEIANRVKILILCGDTSDKIRDAVLAADSGFPIIMCEDLQHAVLKASVLAQNGDIVSMSPACASFDKFKNFEERGNIFKELVNTLNEV